MAPEQACGQALDHHADLYSLGAVLYAAATGRPPLTASSTRDLLGKLSDEAPPPVRESAPDLPEALARLIEWLLEKEPARRPESAASVARALRGLAGSSAPSRRRLTIGPAAAIGFACVVAAGAWLARGLGHSSPRKGTPIASVAIPPGSGGPFSLDGVRRFHTLAAAIAAARSGSTIEIGGDGPYLSGPIRLRAKALTLRAAPGSRPVLRFVPEDQSEPAPCLETDAPLTLEGLQIHSTGHGRAVRGDDPGRFSAISIRGGPFLATHCRFVVGPRNACLALRDGSGEVRACQFSAADGVALYWAPGPEHALDLRQNLLEARAAIIVDIDRLDAGRGEATLRLDHTTVRAHSAVQVFGEIGRGTRGFADASRLDVRIEAGGSVFDASHILTLVDTNSARRFRVLPPMESVAPKIKARIAWRGHDNLYPPSPTWLSFASRGRKITAFADGPADLVAWEQLWDGTGTGSATVELPSHGPGIRDEPDRIGLQAFGR